MSGGPLQELSSLGCWTIHFCSPVEADSVHIGVGYPLGQEHTSSGLPSLSGQQLPAAPQLWADPQGPLVYAEMWTGDVQGIQLLLQIHV